MERKHIRHLALRSCISQKFSLELVHGLFIFCAQSVLIQLSFCNKGEHQTYRDFLWRERLAAYIAELRRLLRWSCSGPECDCGFGNCHRKWQFGDGIGYVLFQRKFGVLAIWRQWSTDQTWVWSKSWLRCFFIGTHRTTPVGIVWSEWLSMNHAGDYTLTIVCMWNMPSSICGYIRSSIFADTINAWLMAHLTRKKFALDVDRKRKWKKGDVAAVSRTELMSQTR